MKFLIDENVPLPLGSALRRLGFDVRRAPLKTPDSKIASQARKEGRILLTFDHDFADRLTYPPSQFNIIHIRIHPPYKDTVLGAFKNLLASLPEEEIRGMIILEKDFHLRFLE